MVRDPSGSRNIDILGEKPNICLGNWDLNFWSWKYFSWNYEHIYICTTSTSKLFSSDFENFWHVFFFHRSVFFFSWKSLNSLTHSPGKPVFFSGGGKKNSFFTHSLDFWPKVAKNNLFREKKNGTFALKTESTTKIK